VIRPARSTELAALADLATRTWAEAFGSSVSPEDEAAQLAETRSEEYFRQVLERHTILVADVDGLLRGYVQFDDTTLHRLYVDAELRGQGLGRELLEAALGHPRLAGAEEVRLQVWEENERALRLYESYGFRVAGTTSFTIGEEVVEDLVLVRSRP
jgi:diamine N-acetyltransferase